MGVGFEGHDRADRTGILVRRSRQGCPGRIHDDNIRHRWRVHAHAEIEAQVGRLVVRVLLPGNGGPVVRIVHQGVHALGGGERRREHHHAGLVGQREDGFLAPIAHDIGHEAGVGLGAVVGHDARHVVERDDPIGLLAGGVPLGDDRPIEQLAHQVAVPPDAEVVGGPATRGGGLGRGDELSGAAVDVGIRAAPDLVALVVLVDVGGEAPSDVAADIELPLDRAGGGVAKRHAGDGRAVGALQAGEVFETLDIGIDVGQVLGVAVSKAGGVHALARFIDSHGSVHDLVPTIGVDIAHDEIVVARTRVLGRDSTGIAVPGPLLDEASIAVPPRFQLDAMVDPARDDEAGVHAIQVRHRPHALLGAVAQLPVVHSGRSPLDHGLAVDVLAPGDLLAGRAFEDGDVVGPVDAVVARILDRGGSVAGHAVAVAIADVLAGPVGESVGGPGGHFRLAVAIEVVDQEIHFHLVDHVGAQVDGPEEGAVELVGFQVVVGGRRRSGIGRKPLDHDLVLAVAVQVAHRGAVDLVARVASLDRPDGDGEVLLGQRYRCRRTRLLHAVDHRRDAVALSGAGGIGGVRHAQCGCDLRGAAIEVVVRFARVFRPGDAPVDHHAAGDGHRDHAPVQAFHPALRMGTHRRQQENAHSQDKTTIRIHRNPLLASVG